MVRPHPASASATDPAAQAFLREACYKVAVPIPALAPMSRDDIFATDPRKRIVDLEGENRSPTRAMELRLGTLLRLAEPHIDGDEFWSRLEGQEDVFGLPQILWLERHQDEHPDFLALAQLRLSLPGNTIPVLLGIDGPATVVRNVYGGIWMPHLTGGTGRWRFWWDAARRGAYPTQLIAYGATPSTQ